MAKKLLNYAAERSDPVLLDYVSVMHSMLKGDLESQSKLKKKNTITIGNIYLKTVKLVKYRFKISR